MNILRLCMTAALSASAFAASAAEPGVPLAGCTDLAAGHEVVRAGGAQSFLVRDGDAHYKVSLRGECGSLQTASRLTIVSEGTEGRLCPAGTRIRTDRATCDVAKVETLSADAFASAKRRARR